MAGTKQITRRETGDQVVKSAHRSPGGKPLAIMQASATAQLVSKRPRKTGKVISQKEQVKDEAPKNSKRKQIELVYQNLESPIDLFVQPASFNFGRFAFFNFSKN